MRGGRQSACSEDASYRDDGGRPVPCMRCVEDDSPPRGGGCSLAPSQATGADLLALAMGGAVAGLFLLARRRRR